MKHHGLTGHLKRTLCIGILFTLLNYSLTAYSQEDWSDQVNARQRFTIYPHVDAGFRALNQKRFEIAIKEFQRALALAPSSQALVSHLAEAYAASGDLNEAILTIDAQLKLTPDVQKLKEMKRIYTQQMNNEVLKIAESLKGNSALLNRYLKDNHPSLDSAYAESVWIELLARSSTPKDNLLQTYKPKFLENDFLKKRLSILMLTKSGAQPQANQLIDRWSPVDLAQISHVDGLRYELLTQGHADQALRILIKAYPFTGASEVERHQLVTRLLIADSRTNDQTQMQVFLEKQKNNIQSSAQEREWLSLVSATVGQRLKPFVDYQIKFRDNASLLEAELQRRLESGAQLPVEVDWEETIAELGQTGDDLLDALTYRLVEAGSNAAAWHLLMTRYPFDGMPSSLREKLVTRLDVI